MAQLRKKFKGSPGDGLMPATIQADNGGESNIHKLSEYDLLIIFANLNDKSKVSASQVCKDWKRIVYGMTSWREQPRCIKATANMEIVAPSLIERGITEVSVSDSRDVPFGNWVDQLRITLRHQLSHLTRIMADSLVSLDLRNIKITVHSRDVLRLFHRSELPKLNRLFLGPRFEVTEWTLRVIFQNCCNLQQLGMSDCRVINKKDSLRKIDLSKLQELSLPLSDIDDEGCKNISEQLPQLRALDLSRTCLRVCGLEHIAKLRNLYRLNLTACPYLRFTAIDILSEARSPIRHLTTSIRPDLVMEHIGKSHLTVTHLTLNSWIHYASDDGIAALLRHGHRHYRSLEIVKESKISSKGMIELVKGVDVLERLVISGEDKTKLAKSVLTG